MIRNNLAVLLAERQIKITRVAKDTGISRSTVTSISQNDTKMIQMEVINKLCSYLKITPEYFFEYIPIDLEYSLIVTKFEAEIAYETFASGTLNEIEFDFFIDQKELNENNHLIQRTYELRGKILKINDDGDLPFSTVICEIDLQFTNQKQEDEFLENLWDKIDPTFKLMTKEAVFNFIKDSLKEELYNLFLEQQNKENIFDDSESKNNKAKDFSRKYHTSFVGISDGLFKTITD